MLFPVGIEYLLTNFTMKNINSFFAKKLNFLLMLLFLVGASTSANAQTDLEDFALFTMTGAVSNAGTSTVNGHVGANVGAISGFVPSSTLNGNVHSGDLVTAQALIDVQDLYNELLLTTPAVAHATGYGSGEIVLPGTYAVASAGSLAGTITLDAGGDPDAVFIFKFGGAYTVGASSNVILSNGAQPCNVFWISGGAISIGALTQMKGTLISSPGAITMATGGTLEGRLLSTTGAIAISNATILAPCVPACPEWGTPCDDGFEFTENDAEDGDCNCIGTYICPSAGTPCNDGDWTTANDVEDGDCNCAGISICLPAGTPCNDGDSSTANDVEDGDCDCEGIYICPSAGTPCNDGDWTTANDVEDGDCNCAGISICPPAGTPCNDGDASTVNDVEDGDCYCAGIYTLSPDLGAMANFALFTSAGALSNAGTSNIWGDVGTNAGAVAGFGAPTVLGGVVHAANATTAAGVIDVQNLYNELLAVPSTEGHAPAFGAGETLTPGVYAIGGAGSVGGNLTLDGQGDPNAVFVFKFGGAFTTGASATVTLIGGAQPCNLYWISGGAIAMATNTTMAGTVISGAGAVSMAVGGILEGRLLTTAGAVAVSGASITNPCMPLTRRSNVTDVSEEVSVYPNPATDNIYISFKDFAGKAGTIMIYNSAGQKVDESNYLSFPTMSAEFDVSGLSNGIYMIAIEVEDYKRVTKRVILNK
jgi:hypothetical protein